MTGADSKLLADRRIVARLTIGIAVMVGLFAGVVRLHLFYSRKFHDVTGRAQWIWQQKELSRGQPAAFFATRDFDLPASRYYTKIRLAADPQYTLFFNGAEIAGRETAGNVRLQEFDVSKLARTGRNRIVVALRSKNGVGGLLAAVAISPEVTSYVVTDSTWKVVPTWSPDLPWRDGAGAQTPMLLGEPPAGPWNFLSPIEARFAARTAATRTPVEAFTFKAQLRQIKIVSGVAIAGSIRQRALAYDFGTFVEGRLRLTLRDSPPVSRLVTVRFANAREELFPLEGNIHSFVFAAGERTITDPQTRVFRYVVVYGGDAVVEVAR